MKQVLAAIVLLVSACTPAFAGECSGPTVKVAREEAATKKLRVVDLSKGQVAALQHALKADSDAFNGAFVVSKPGVKDKVVIVILEGECVIDMEVISPSDLATLISQR